ncbi:fused MFS/spermidine synthase [Actinocrispum sp. NPDC049592]|uniref:spermidine synthase n=1 Tax=Actinocrispum sp. NPDC049592 TaxID=3154835 RepID=UPI00341E4462
MARKARPTGPGRRAVRFGTAELMRDLDRPNGWYLSVDGVAQSYVDLDDPGHLEFDYVRRMGDVIDLMPAGPVDAVHVGGGACTLARYVAFTRPGSRQLVLDLDGELIAFVREFLALSSVRGLRVRVQDGREGVASRRDESADLVVLDAFARASMPGGLATAEFTRDVARVLRPGGTYVVNISDGPGLRFAKQVMATVASEFPSMALLADPGILRGRRFGNLVLAASSSPLPAVQLAGRAASAAFPARVVAGDKLRDLWRGASVITDGMDIVTPTPPDTAFM